MKCAHYDERTRCENDAVYWILSPSGNRVPGCYNCAKHAIAMVKEYAEKINEFWGLEPIDEFGNRRNGI